MESEITSAMSSDQRVPTIGQTSKISIDWNYRQSQKRASFVVTWIWIVNVF